MVLLTPDWCGWLILAFALLCPSPPARADFQGATHLMPFEEETINYNQTKAGGPVARLQERIDRGELKLKHDDSFGYLLSLLRELKVTESSQMLVFSKTSFQTRTHLSEGAPRHFFQRRCLCRIRSRRAVAGNFHG